MNTDFENIQKEILIFSKSVFIFVPLHDCEHHLNMLKVTKYSVFKYYKAIYPFSCETILSKG